MQAEQPLASPQQTVVIQYLQQLFLKVERVQAFMVFQPATLQLTFQVVQVLVVKVLEQAILGKFA